MRMWNVNPTLLCQKHLGGEHVECHMFVGTINKGMKLRGYLDKGLVEVHNIGARHDELAEEMTRRGYHHKSPLPDVELWTEGHVDSSANLVELARRCPECRKRIEARSKTHV